MGFKIPTLWDGIGAAVGSIPRVIKWFKDRGRVKDVNKIENAVDTGDDKSVNSILSDIVRDSEKRQKADS